MATTTSLDRSKYSGTATGPSKTGCNRSRPVFFGFSIFQQTLQLATKKIQNLCSRNRWSCLLQLGSVRFRSFFQSSELDLRTLVADSQGPHNSGNTILLIDEVSSSSQKWYGWHATFSVFMTISGDGNVEWVSGKQDKASATVFSSPLMYTIFALNCDIDSIQCA